MRRLLPFTLASLALALAACGDDGARAPTAPTPAAPALSASPNAPVTDGMDAYHVPNAHVFLARGQAGRQTKSPNLTYHGGDVLHSTVVTTAIFWGTSWSRTSFVGDKMSGIDAFYAGYGGSGYAKTNTEYTDGVGAVTAGLTYGGHLVDPSAGPTRAPSTADIVNEVCSVLSANGRAASPNGYYPVYVDMPRGHLQYCAWHSHGPCGGTDIQVGLVLNLDGDAGCDPADTQTSHSQGLAALANVSGHELSEAVTDPNLDAWYDAQGAENSDKCAWSFSGNLVKLGKASWKIQGNWSNAAYNAGTGFANRDGQNGCIDGA